MENEVALPVADIVNLHGDTEAISSAGAVHSTFFTFDQATQGTTFVAERP